MKNRPDSSVSNIEPLFTIGHNQANQAIVFTNSSLYMFLAVAVTAVLMLGGGTGGWFPAAFQSNGPKSATSFVRRHDPQQWSGLGRQ